MTIGLSKKLLCAGLFTLSLSAILPKTGEAQTLSDQLRAEMRAGGTSSGPAARQRPHRAARAPVQRAVSRVRHGKGGIPPVAAPVKVITVRPEPQPKATVQAVPGGFEGAVERLPGVVGIAEVNWRQDPRVISLRLRLSKSLTEGTVRALLDGDPGDVLVIVNESASAPNAARQLSGAITFASDIAAACAIKSSSYSEPLDRYIQIKIRTLYPQLAFLNYQPTKRDCNRGLGDDLTLLRRGDLLLSDSFGFGVVDALGRRQLGYLTRVSIADFQETAARAVQAQRSAYATIDAGAFQGYTTLQVPGGEANAICVSDKIATEVGNKVLQRLREETIFEDKWPATPVLRVADSDQSFLTAKRLQCGFVFGEGAYLTALEHGLRRDGISVRSTSVAIDEASFKAIDLEVVAGRNNQTLKDNLSTEEAQRQKQAEQQANQAMLDHEKQRLLEQHAAEQERQRLAAAARKNDEIAMREEIARQRQIVASRAQTIVDGFADKLRRHLASVDDELKGFKDRTARGETLSAEEAARLHNEYHQARLDDWFPDWSAWATDQAKAEWKFNPPVFALEDFGTAKWKDRTIEAISVRVTLPMLNKVIGERRETCQVFTWINDEEFSFYRSPMTTDCASYDSTSKDWATANRFSSAWKVPVK